MKLIYFLYSDNLSQFSYLYNLFLYYPSPIYCPTFDKINLKTLPEKITSAIIFRNIGEIYKYKPDFLLHTGNSGIDGPWKNIFVGHGYATNIFSNNCSKNIIATITNYDINTMNNNIYDYIISPSKLIADEIYKQTSIPKHKIIVIGPIRYEKINKKYLINYNKKKNIIYAPHWRLNPSVLIMQNYIEELSKYFNIYVLFHSNSINNIDSKADVVNAQKKIISCKNDSLKILFRDEYSNLFKDCNQKYVVKDTNKTLNILQEYILSCDFVLCDTYSSVFWDALYFKKPFNSNFK